MGIIPLSPEDRIEVTDGEATFHFRYLLGENQEKYAAIQARQSEAILPFIRQAKEEIGDSDNTDADQQQKVQQRILKRASQLAIASGVSANNFSYSREIIDIFLCGWQHPKFPPFPKDGHPSRSLRIRDIGKVMDLLNKQLPELIGLEVEDQKN